MARKRFVNYYGKHSIHAFKMENIVDFPQKYLKDTMRDNLHSNKIDEIKIERESKK